jgi:hypothetical protein
MDTHPLPVAAYLISVPATQVIPVKGHIKYPWDGCQYKVEYDQSNNSHNKATYHLIDSSTLGTDIIDCQLWKETHGSKCDHGQ